MKLKLIRLTITPSFALIDDKNIVYDLTDGSPFVMFPGKYLEFRTLVEKLEEAVNSDKDSLDKLSNRPLL